jgi:ATP phosphoribosyltransferase regulatory subunit
MTSGLLPEGLRDRLPPYADAADTLMHAVAEVIRSHGYQRVHPPLAEFEEELAGRLTGTGKSDLFRLIDPVSQRTLAIRPDITAQIGRIATTRLGYGGATLKLRSTQLRPERELIQTGAELIGTDSPPAAIEIILLALDALAAAGVSEITIDLTLPNLVETLAAKAIPLAPAKVDAVRARLDAKDAGGLMALGAEAYLPLLAATGRLPDALQHLRQIDSGHALDARLSAIELIADAIGDRARVTLDPTERHGFEYQSWLGFSFFAHGIAGEIGRGGSYTILHEDGHEEQAIGFSLYLDPLVDAGFGQRDAKRIFIPLGAPQGAAARLRAEGWETVAALSGQDSAAALGCTHILRGGVAQPL